MSIRLKILGSFIGFILLIVTILTLSVSRVVETSIRDNIDLNFRKAGQIFERIQDVRFRQLRQTAILLADIPNLKAAMSTRDVNTITAQIRDELKYNLDFFPVLPDTLLPESLIADTDSVGLILVTNPDGIPLGQMSNQPLPDYSLAAIPGIRKAMLGEYPTSTSIWEQYGRYFNVVTVPVWIGDRLLGTVSIGFPMHQLEVKQFATDTGNDVIYYINDHVYLNTISHLSAKEKQDLARKIHDATFDVNQTGEAHTIESEIAGEDWLFYITSMNKNEKDASVNGFYVVAKSLSVELKPLERLQLLIISIGAIVALIALIIGVIITTRINKPIRSLIEGIERIEAGDYQTPVPVTTSDEIGVLTNTFNNLVTNLRERLMMLKFVSDATLDAIKNTMSDIQLGGTRRDVTVFFSDIRGFTKWSEKRTPEQVIDMINTLLRFQADIIKQNHGDIDKFVGDEVVAVFRGENKEQHAVNAGMEIQRKSKELLEQYAGEIAIGIGINTGEVVMGAMGSEQRMDFTVLGNHVNLGARLCSAAKPYQILISKPVADCLERRVEIHPLEPIMVKGIAEPVQIFDVSWE
ncbi:HAMP domain-containing protein [bacterium]|nr:MAG: HAMP domain-containing protein [bacterium]